MAGLPPPRATHPQPHPQPEAHSQPQIQPHPQPHKHAYPHKHPAAQPGTDTHPHPLPAVITPSEIGRDRHPPGSCSDGVLHTSPAALRPLANAPVPPSLANLPSSSAPLSASGRGMRRSVSSAAALAPLLPPTEVTRRLAKVRSERSAAWPSYQPNMYM